ncbi:MAG: hypothetical protein O7C56_09645, partial [Rickettsia endosymbiont of Ixodes persulcatus]|nr:hypothetical protein [Rickettsia endosymbiont of Ixodes persulcatus]
MSEDIVKLFFLHTFTLLPLLPIGLNGIKTYDFANFMNIADMLSPPNPTGYTGNSYNITLANKLKGLIDAHLSNNVPRPTLIRFGQISANFSTAETEQISKCLLAASNNALSFQPHNLDNAVMYSKSRIKYEKVNIIGNSDV